MQDCLPPDTLNDIGVLKRREIEARILAPLINALAAEFGREGVIEIAKRVIVEIARQQGKVLAGQVGGNSLDHFVSGKDPWVKGDALQIEVLQATGTSYHFNVTRCRYAEMYRALGIPELGVVLSCGRDYALGEGFNPDLTLTRTQTIMEGAPFCDFRYRLEPPSDQK
ncbi:MAG: L-2-amino-thiazoline-4-carboxylic acid hydrolase [candidate division NC10 bacterium]|nr:L-2-amino-thiazoline-4-carboxylic acid hydrolase [candidate division NC10 bacterium]MBI4840070.1 L-2-amino-thiazoline-4-carboxylic acid hydrolase [candidate division NC10 bacterium]